MQVCKGKCGKVCWGVRGGKKGVERSVGGGERRGVETVWVSVEGVEKSEKRWRSVGAVKKGEGKCG